jgi:hypothetical protein
MVVLYFCGLVLVGLVIVHVPHHMHDHFWLKKAVYIYIYI